MEYLESPNNRFQNQINNKLRRSSDLQRCCSNGTSQTFGLFFSKGLLLYTQRCACQTCARSLVQSLLCVSLPFRIQEMHQFQETGSINNISEPPCSRHYLNPATKQNTPSVTDTNPLENRCIQRSSNRNPRSTLQRKNAL